MITIIIVSKDNEQGIEKTLSSITFDGALTIQIIIKRFSKVERTKVSGNMLEIWGPDSGIYHAMNIAIGSSTGDWLCFMNAGDQFARPLDEFFCHLNDFDIFDVVYGDHIVDGIRYSKSKSPYILYLGSAFCHQSAFIKRDRLFKGYDLGYKLSADYDFFLSLYVLGFKFKRLPLPISIIESGGVSDTNRRVVYDEWRSIQFKYFGRRFWIISVYYFRLFRNFVRRFFVV